jgi:hypothetical protein
VPKIIFCSVLTEGFSDPALGELVLACEALGVDPQQHVHTVTGSLRHLSGVDAAVQPRGQAGMPQIVRSPGKRRGLFGGTECHLARFRPAAPVRDGGQIATPHAAFWPPNDAQRCYPCATVWARRRPVFSPEPAKRPTLECRVAAGVYGV